MRDQLLEFDRPQRRLNVVFYLGTIVFDRHIFFISAVLTKPDIHPLSQCEFARLLISPSCQINCYTASNYTDDEVLLNALGYSIFEALKPKNIIFEGWADKHVFELATTTTKGRGLKEINAFGRVHSTGVKNIIGIAKDLELANRVYCVISDSDRPALEKRRIYQENEQCQGKWYTYDEVVAGVYTLEDFIKHTAFKNPIEQVRAMHPELGAFDHTAFKSQNFRREEFIKNWVKGHVPDNAQVKAIVAEIKDILYSNLTGSNIEDIYYTFLSNFNQRLTSI